MLEGRRRGKHSRWILANFKERLRDLGPRGYGEASGASLTHLREKGLYGKGWKAELPDNTEHAGEHWTRLLT